LKEDEMNTADEKKKMIANRLRLAREYAGLSQSQAAQILDLHRPSISEMEAGRRNVTADELAKLAEIYDVGIDWLVGGDQESKDEIAARVELAARELSKLKPEDLDQLLKLLSTMRNYSGR
jgi:transcriptional regulator with XRE-family HTH domain